MLQQLFRQLEPWYFISRHRERQLWLREHPVLATLWNWAVQTCRSHAERSKLGATDRMRLFVAITVALVLNPEDVCAYVGAARLCADFSKRLARQVGFMAVARGGS